jgi:2-polyprenyl-3-methyl-5-hydroxy-6-metoxy-1,4-benzoquinol methylase
MTSCCTSSAACSVNNLFFSRWSNSYVKRFRRKGLEKAQKRLLEGVRCERLQPREVLDIGCGVGAFH